MKLHLLFAWLLWLLPLSQLQATDDSFRLVVAGPHTGPSAAYREQMLKGARKAAEDINKLGGILGKKIEIIKVDDECKPSSAVNAANDIVNKYKAHGVIGHFCSSATIPASKTYMEHNTIMVTPSSTSPRVTDRRFPNILRMCGRDDQQGIIAARFIAKKLKAKSVAYVHDKTTYGLGLAKSTRDNLKSQGPGVKEVLFEGITRGDKDFNTLVTKMKAQNTEVIYFGGLHTEAGPLLKQIRQQGLKAIFVSGDGVVSNDFVTAAGGGQFVEGAYVTFGRDPQKLSSSKAVVDSFLKLGYKPEGYTLYSYAAVEAITQAIKATKSTKGKQLADWLKKNPVATVMGVKAWNKKGDLRESDYVIYRWDKNGDFNEI